MTKTKTQSNAGAQPRASQLRFYQYKGDNMEPTIRNRDFILLAPVDRYVGEGYYLVGNTFGETIYSCSGSYGTRENPAIRLHPHNKFYSGEEVPCADFDEKVLGKVAMICNVVDHHLLPDMRGAR